MNKRTINNRRARWLGWLIWRPSNPKLRPVTYAIQALLTLFIAVGVAPEVLAWPHTYKIGQTVIYSERPIPNQISEVLARADALVETGPVKGLIPARRLFLSSGGWRWFLLSAFHYDAFGLRRPFHSSLVLNDSDIAADVVRNGRKLAGKRSLSGVIAHETTHYMIGVRYGEFRALTIPDRKEEGLAELTARETSLTAQEYLRLKNSGARHPAMTYFEAARCAEEFLKHNPGAIDRFLLDSDSC